MAGFTPTSGADLLAGQTALSLVDTGLAGGTTYYYVLVATDTGNGNAVINYPQYTLPNPTVKRGVAGFGYSLSITAGATTTFDNITEITPPPAAVNELKAKIGSGAKAGVEIVAPGSKMAQQIKGKAIYTKADYLAMQALLGVEGTVQLTLASDCQAAVGLFSGAGFLSNISEEAINDSGMMEYDFTISVDGDTMLA